MVWDVVNRDITYASRYSIRSGSCVQKRGRGGPRNHQIMSGTRFVVEARLRGEDLPPYSDHGPKALSLRLQMETGTRDVNGLCWAILSVM